MTKRMKLLAAFGGCAGVLCLACVVALLLPRLVFRTYKAVGSGMSPALAAGDLFWVSSWANRQRPPERGDIVVFMMRDQQLVKRVIGLPGERVTMRDGEVFIDGQPLKESYIDETTLPGRGMEVSLSDEEVFVLGDNRSNSSDSRNLGPIPLDSVLGKVVFVLAPDRMELVLCQS